MSKPKRGIVAVDTDGSIKWYFEGLVDAERALNICHKDLGVALKDHSRHVKGYVWWYENEYRDLWFEKGEEYFSWIPSETHKRKGSGFAKGHKLSQMKHLWSAEGRKRQSEAARMNCIRRKEAGGYRAQAERQMKPIRCVTDGMEFKSMKHCGEYYGIPLNYISAAVKRDGTARNLKFEFI